MGKRIVSGAALLVIAAVALLRGGTLLAGILLAISCIAYRELCRATGVHAGRIGMLEASGYLGIVLYYFLIWQDGQGLSLVGEGHMGLALCALCVGMLMLMLAVYVFTFPKYCSEQVMAAYFCVLYAPVLLSFIYLTGKLRYGVYLVWMILISSWVCDTCAYFTGVAFGKHRMAPVLSPKKSVEGAIGGIVGSAVIGALFSVLVAKQTAPGEAITVAFAVIAGVGAVLSQIGDLAASAIKRNHGIKDYGSCIPGHGGIMDRFDSVIFTAPVIYFMARIWIGA